MTRIGSTLSGMERSLLNRLAEANAETTICSLRMATGQKINHPSDDPSTFVRLSGLQARLSNVQTTMSNVTAAASMVSQAQSAIDQIQTQLNTIRTELLKDKDGDLTPAERDEAQANIDAAIAQINSLASTDIDGRRMLDGSANFIISGKNSSQVAELRVYSTGGVSQTVSGYVTQAATQAELTYTGDASNQVTDAATFTLAGERGDIEVEVTSGQTLSNVAAEINSNSHLTGVTAEVDEVAHTLTFTSVDYGSDVSVAVDVTSGTFNVSGGGSTTGTDAEATIDGIAYTGNGNSVAVNSNGVRYTIEFDPTFTGSFDTITVEGDALTYALTTDLTRRSTLSIPGMQAAKLGGQSGSINQLASGGTLAGLDANTSQAIRVVDEALADVTRIEGAVDGFYNATISSASGLLSDLEEDLENAIDDINLVDDIEETVRLSYYQDLASNAITGLYVLQQQRTAIVSLIQQLAGL